MVFRTPTESITIQVKQEIFVYLHNTTRVLLFLMQKFDSILLLSDSSIDFAQTCYEVVHSEIIPYDTKSNCGLLLVYACNYLPSHLVDNFVSIFCNSHVSIFVI